MFQDAKKTTPKDFFINVFSIIALYVSAVSVTTILFQFVNVGIPDIIDSEYIAHRDAYEKIRVALASLIVFFPAYLAAQAYLSRMYMRVPEKRNVWIRKWLIYFTVFASSVIVMGDIASLIYRVLSGELTIRFLLKSLSLLLAAGAVVFYYGSEIHKQRLE